MEYVDPIADMTNHPLIREKRHANRCSSRSGVCFQDRDVYLGNEDRTKGAVPGTAGSSYGIPACASYRVAIRAVHQAAWLRLRDKESLSRESTCDPLNDPHCTGQHNGLPHGRPELFRRHVYEMTDHDKSPISQATIPLVNYRGTL